MSRRAFANSTLAAAAAQTTLAQTAASFTADQVLDRIRKNSRREHSVLIAAGDQEDPPRYSPPLPNL